MSGRRGSVLLLALWATATLAALGIAQATHVSLELKWVSRNRQERQAWHWSWTTLELVRLLLASDANSYDAPKEPLQFQGPDAPPAQLSYRISDEQAKIPLNSASVKEPILQRLPGMSPQVMTQFLIRRDDPVSPKPLSHLAELAVLGVESHALDELESLVTTYGENPVNINTASIDVLQILGISSSLSSQIFQYRNGPDGASGTDDDGVFESSQEIIPTLENLFSPLAPEDQITLATLLESQPALLGGATTLFRVEAQGQTVPGGIRKKIVCVMERSGNLRSWYEN